jgi:8-oxo-dGTP pyrophosphatase MutT (NUDIX family)
MSQRTELSAGGVVYRRVAGRIEVAVADQRDRVTHRRTTRLPKGKLDTGESAERAALREVGEEIGLHARVVGSLGRVAYQYAEGSERVDKQVEYFLMEWLRGEPVALDGEMDRAYWLALDEAERRLSFDTERRAIGWARERLAAEARESA